MNLSPSPFDPCQRPCSVPVRTTKSWTRSQSPTIWRAWPNLGTLIWESLSAKKPSFEYGTQAIEGLARDCELRAYFVPNKLGNIVSSGDAIFCMLDDYFGESMDAVEDCPRESHFLESRVCFLQGILHPSGEHPMIHLPVPCNINGLKRKMREIRMPTRP